MTLNTENTNST